MLRALLCALLVVPFVVQAVSLSCDECNAYSASCNSDAFCTASVNCVTLKQAGDCDAACYDACTSAIPVPSANGPALLTSALFCLNACPALQSLQGDCVTSFNSSAKTCNDLVTLNACVQSLVQSTMDTSGVDATTEYVVPAVLLQYDLAASEVVGECEFFAFADLLRPVSVDNNGGIVLSEIEYSEDGDVSDILLHRYSEHTTRVIELAYDAMHVPSENAHTDYLNNLVSQSQTALNTLASTMRTTLAGKASVSDSLLSRLPGLIQSIATVNNTLSDVSEDIAQAFRPVEANVVKEILSKELARSSITDRIANTLTSITASNTQNSRDIITIANDDYSYRNSIVDAISTQVSSFVSQENARAATKSASLASENTGTQSYLSSTMATQVSAQVVRANSQILVNPVPTSLKMPTQTGSLDNTACSSPGQVYYSTSSGQIWYCDGVQGIFVTPWIFTRNFVGSTILDQVTIPMMTKRMAYNNWALCYSALRDGWSSTTFHNNCNNRYYTISIAHSTEGRIWGGYFDYFWASRSNYVTGYSNSFLYRIFNGDLQWVNNNNNVYSVYDQVSYCTTFGNGHDWYLDSNCRNGYTALNNAYYYNMWDNNYLAGSYSSWQLDRFEVWYKI